jgi:hypothetical protein
LIRTSAAALAIAAFRKAPLQRGADIVALHGDNLRFPYVACCL